MKTAIINLADDSIASTYDGAPNQAGYGGPWGQASQFAHVQVPSGEDIRWCDVSVDSGDGSVSLVVNSGRKTSVQAADTQAAVKSAISAARSFGTALLDQFAAENVLLGITADNMTGTVLDNMAPIMACLQSGSLKEAIIRAKALGSDKKDAKYITDARLLSYVNQIETYLGVTLSTSLS